MLEEVIALRVSCTCFELLGQRGAAEEMQLSVGGGLITCCGSVSSEKLFTRRG